MCAHCLMYAGVSAWERRNKDEVLHLGRLLQGTALMNKRQPPDLDERGRIDPRMAELYMMSVGLTTAALVKGCARGSARSLS